MLERTLAVRAPDRAPAARAVRDLALLRARACRSRRRSTRSRRRWSSSSTWTRPRSGCPTSAASTSSHAGDPRGRRRAPRRPPTRSSRAAADERAARPALPPRRAGRSCCAPGIAAGHGRAPPARAVPAKGSTAAVIPMATPGEILGTLTLLSLDPARPLDEETVEAAMTVTVAGCARRSTTRASTSSRRTSPRRCSARCCRASCRRCRGSRSATCTSRPRGWTWAATSTTSSRSRTAASPSSSATSPARGSRPRPTWRWRSSASARSRGATPSPSSFLAKRERGRRRRDRAREVHHDALRARRSVERPSRPAPARAIHRCASSAGRQGGGGPPRGPGARDRPGPGVPEQEVALEPGWSRRPLHGRRHRGTPARRAVRRGAAGRAPRPARDSVRPGSSRRRSWPTAARSRAASSATTARSSVSAWRP